MPVYFIQDARGNVKIGYTYSVVRRFKALQAGNIAPLFVMRVVPGAGAAERWYHKRFAAQRIVREWFDFHPDMLIVAAPDNVANELPPRMRGWKHDVAIREDTELFRGFGL